MASINPLLGRPRKTDALKNAVFLDVHHFLENATVLGRARYKLLDAAVLTLDVMV